MPFLKGFVCLADVYKRQARPCQVLYPDSLRHHAGGWRSGTVRPSRNAVHPFHAVVVKDTIEEKEEYRIEWIQERIEDATIRIEETKKLVADIEKMA